MNRTEMVLEMFAEHSITWRGFYPKKGFMEFSRRENFKLRVYVSLTCSHKLEENICLYRMFFQPVEFSRQLHKQIP
jgi:hypothetical protein